MFLGTMIYALINSVILALMAIGFNLTFGISGVANFAYGAFYILAAFVTWMLLYLVGLPFWLRPSSPSSLQAFGALMYRFVLLRVRGQVLSEVIATFGIGLAILELFRYLGFVGVEYTLPVFIDESFMIGDTMVDMQRILIVICGRPARPGSGFHPSHLPRTGLSGDCPGRTHGPHLRHGLGLDRHLERLLRRRACGLRRPSSSPWEPSRRVKAMMC